MPRSGDAATGVFCAVDVEEAAGAEVVTAAGAAGLAAASISSLRIRPQHRCL